jgi:hypothetical protein
MTPDGIRKLLRHQPFKPFRLVMSSGREYEIRHPEMAMLLQNDILVGVDITDNGMPAEFDICPLLHVASIEPFNLQDSNPTP